MLIEQEDYTQFNGKVVYVYNLDNRESICRGKIHVVFNRANNYYLLSIDKYGGLSSPCLGEVETMEYDNSFIKVTCKGKNGFVTYQLRPDKAILIIRKNRKVNVKIDGESNYIACSLKSDLMTGENADMAVIGDGSTFDNSVVKDFRVITSRTAFIQTENFPKGYLVTVSKRKFPRDDGVLDAISQANALSSKYADPNSYDFSDKMHKKLKMHEKNIDYWTSMKQKYQNDVDPLLLRQNGVSSSEEWGELCDGEIKDAETKRKKEVEKKKRESWNKLEHIKKVITRCVSNEELSVYEATELRSLYIKAQDCYELAVTAFNQKKYHEAMHFLDVVDAHLSAIERSMGWKNRIKIERTELERQSEEYRNYGRTIKKGAGHIWEKGPLKAIEWHKNNTGHKSYQDAHKAHREKQWGSWSGLKIIILFIGFGGFWYELQFFGNGANMNPLLLTYLAIVSAIAVVVDIFLKPHAAGYDALREYRKSLPENPDDKGDGDDKGDDGDNSGELPEGTETTESKSNAASLGIVAGLGALFAKKAYDCGDGSSQEATGLAENATGTAKGVVTSAGNLTRETIEKAKQQLQERSKSLGNK